MGGERVCFLCYFLFEEDGDGLWRGRKGFFMRRMF